MAITTNHTSRAVVLAVAALGAAAACTKNERPPTALTAGEVATAQPSAPDDACPVLVPGTTVTTANTKDGVEATFTTEGDVIDLRRRVAAMADAIRTSSSLEPGSQTTGDHELAMPPSHVQLTPVEGGARLRLTPRDAHMLDQLRLDMHRRAVIMSVGRTCPAITSSARAG